MKVLVTGGKGYIGTRLINRMQLFPHWSIDIMDTRTGEDILDGRSIKKYMDCDKVIHLANDWNHPNNNVAIATVLAEAFSPERIVFASSAAVYGNGLNLKESDPLNPVSAYGESKKICEDVLKGATILRLFNVYGGGYGIIDLLLNRPKTVIYGDGTQVRDYIFIDDIITAFLYATNEWVPRDTYNIGTGVGTSINELVDLLKVKDKVVYDLSASNLVGVHECVANVEKMQVFPFFAPIKILGDLL